MAASASGQARAGACEDGVQVCVERVCKHTALGKKKRKKKKEKRKEKKGMQTYCKPIHWLHGTGNSMPVVSLWVEGHGQSCANHRPCTEAVGGGDMQVMHATWVQAVVVETLYWHGNLIFWPGKGGGTRGWYLGACQEGAQMHRTGKKKKTKAKKTTKKKKRKMDSPVQTPTKTLTSTGLACIMCMCGFGEGGQGGMWGRRSQGWHQAGVCWDLAIVWVF